jgi:chorismate synthase
VIAFAKEIGGVEAKSMEIHPKKIQEYRDVLYSNPVRALDLERAKEMEEEIRLVKGEGDSVGGIIECVALNVPAGLGEPVFEKLSAELAKAICSIPAVKGIEFGIGFEAARMRGSEVNDAFDMKGKKVVTQTNRAGGISGGISNGMPIMLRVAIKPTASISKEQDTVDLKTKKKAKIKIEGRHDPCIVPRAVPIVEAMAALVLADMGLRNGSIPRSLV